MHHMALNQHNPSNQGSKKAFCPSEVAASVPALLGLELDPAQDSAQNASHGLINTTLSMKVPKAFCPSEVPASVPALLMLDLDPAQDSAQNASHGLINTTLSMKVPKRLSVHRRCRLRYRRS